MMDNLILKAAKKLKTFTLDDIIMTNLDEKYIAEFLTKSNNIKQNGKFYEDVSCYKEANKLKIIDKNCKINNSDITVIKACEEFLRIYQDKQIKTNTIKAYKTFINAYIIPYFKIFYWKIFP